MGSSADFGAGMVRYTVFVVVPAPDDPDEVDSFQFVATAPFLPRTGESLEFDGPGGFGLSLLVTEVTHWFFDAADAPGQPFKLVVEGKPVPTGLADAQKLLDPAALEHWVQQYPTLELSA
ncbi:hypothetical protein [Nocardia cerradoensis]|uniref:Uncharacterized protein n=1 Tax=Nocardia cerradoensis TaxID=85688 RepID=A0A231GT25_9NOCA|nr:hypothetical protein [Nocardia cerradoensis]NKY43560.1 hypothetical protein [Nocardia cerradoensis]OXR39732.1 hypothetical protein B7C42_08193 [Nocardia cerradoensis]